MFEDRMMKKKNGVIKPVSPVNFIDEPASFTVIGDPGCDGLGAEIMATFAKGLTTEADPDFGIILGDIVPVGRENFYKNISRFIDTISVYPVYMLCGNHDTDSYTLYFGLKNYILVSEKVLFIFLDDSNRKFDDTTLEFLSGSLKKYSRDNIVVLFHVPPPNRYSKNSISTEEWDKFKAISAPFRSKIKYILCGHVHSFFEDTVDGMKLIVSGGGGARIEYVSDSIDKMKAFHHILKFFFDKKGELVYKHITLDGKLYENELKDKKLNYFLQNAFQNECMAHVRYRLFAEDAEEKGMYGMAKLFRAASDSEYYHAKNHFNNLNLLKKISNNLDLCYNNEDFEVTKMYKDYYEYADKKDLGLAKYSFFDAFEAEKVHRNLFEKAKPLINDGKDTLLHKYFTCTSCGYTFESGEHPKTCPVCGAPSDKISEVK
jgi:rubrerythrin